jgi:ABC-type glycerol-3-phosphate transport system permease component
MTDTMVNPVHDMPSRAQSHDRPGAGGLLSVGVRKFLLFLPLALLTIWTLAPFFITLSISFKRRSEVFSNPTILPSDPTLAPYIEVLEREGFQGAFMNSVIVGIGTTLLTLALAVPAAYAFVRFRFRGRHLLLLFTLLPRLVPHIGIMIPLYTMAAALGLLDRRITLILVYSGMLLPLAVWLLVGFFQKIPRELEEAASLDGCSTIQRFRYVILPLAFPALLTIAVLAFREAWNEFTLVLVLTTTPGKRTLPYELFLMQGGSGIENYPAEAAFTMVTILLYSRFERYITAGITTGSVK